MWTTRRSQRRHRLYIVMDFYKKKTYFEFAYLFWMQNCRLASYTQCKYFLTACQLLAQKDCKFCFLTLCIFAKI